jgi:beta-lactamase class A
MFLFKKKREEDGRETDKRENIERRKKKEVKPWGKKERLIVLVVFLFSIFSSAFLALRARKWKLPGLPRVEFKKISLPFVSEEVLIIEKDEKLPDVVNYFKETTDKVSGVWGLYGVDLLSNSIFSYNEGETFQAASLMKLPVMVSMYKEAELENVDLESTYKLRAEDKAEGSGNLYLKPVGTQLSYRDLIRLMGQESDNTAFRAAVFILGEEKVAGYIKEFGMVSTSYEENKTTPKDIGELFNKIWRGEIINEKDSSELLGFLTDTVYENHLPAGIPDKVRVAHKYAREVHVVNDAGIVYADKPFILVILSDGVVEKEADELFPELVKGIYELRSY